MVTAIKATDYERWEEPDPPEEKTDSGAIESGMPDDAYHALPSAYVAARLGTDLEDGLAETAVSQRQEQYGPNTLQASQRTPWYVVLGRQFVDVLIFILFIAAIISAVLGEMVDAIAIVAIMLLNGVLGFVQEWKAEQAIEALQQMLSPRCRVVRGGHEREINADELVPGDMVLLTIGDRVPADVRLARTFDLKIDESSLTGESVPVNKGAESVALDAPLAERPSIAWMGTAVTNGHGRGVVVATGMDTEFGRIAQMTQTVQEEASPLQRQLAVLGKQLAIIAIGISVLVSLLGWLTGKPLLDMFLTGVSLAVAAVPEGLPAVVTLTLALGIRAMVRRRALLRRLQAAETLGSTTLICTDKTGTLTQNEMTVQQIWLPDGAVAVTGVGYDPAGHFTADGHKLNYKQRLDLIQLLETGLWCNNARINKEADGWHQLGNPTEAALITVAYKAWLPASAPEKVAEFPFDSQRKRMTVVLRQPEGLVAHAKGAPEVMLSRCTRVLDGGEERPLIPADYPIIQDAYQDLARQGLRTLAMARRTLPQGIPFDEEAVENDLTLLGVVGIIDPPRPEVPAAIQMAHSAGIGVMMITGDAAETAVSIAERVGLPVTNTITGSELEAMDDDTLKPQLHNGTVFARATPAHKLRLVTLLQGMGHVVGMTGDGVNDAPALKKADIGIAMGLRGTEVARGAADMVLTDDNFASIIGAIEEGRRQYDNIQKFVRYLLSSNTAEIVAILGNILVGGPLVLMPVQILWMNLVTDGVTAVALGLEPAEKDIMERPPRDPQAAILSRFGLGTIALLGGYMGLATLWLFYRYLNAGYPLIVAQTMAFTGLILLEKMNVFNFRALRLPLRRVGFFSNPWVLVAWMSMVGLQITAVYLPFLQNLLHTTPLAWQDWAVMILLALPVFIVPEVIKMTGKLSQKSRVLPGNDRQHRAAMLH